MNIDQKSAELARIILRELLSSKHEKEAGFLIDRAVQKLIREVQAETRKECEEMLE